MNEIDSASPRKYILDKPHLVETFRNSASFANIITYIQACSEAVEGTPRSARVVQNVAELHPTVRFFVETFFPHLNKIVDEVPLEDAKQQRFGNRAFRVFHKRLEEDVEALARELAMTLPAAQGAGAEDTLRRVAVELAGYFKDSFGNSTRIDYGTGHELHFFIVMMICMKECGDGGGTLRAEHKTIVPVSFVPPPRVELAEEKERLHRLRQGFVFDVFGAYILFMRRLQKHYGLEPAGSHGVWGLDDYHHLPFIFGAAQLIGKENGAQSATCGPGEETGRCAILPEDVCKEKEVRRHADEYFYFAQIAWVLDNKRGPFFEHSRMLYNISGVESWEKTYTGMIKMYAVEVLAKFNVVQHLLFCASLPWPEASTTAVS